MVAAEWLDEGSGLAGVGDGLAGGGGEARQAEEEGLDGGSSREGGEGWCRGLKMLLSTSCLKMCNAYTRQHS